MKRSIKFAHAAVVAVGLAAVAAPVMAHQAQTQHGDKPDGAMNMMGGHDGMMGMMGMMMGNAMRGAMANFDTNADGTLSPEETTAGIKAELATYDTDANGTLSLDEFAVLHAAHMRPMMVRAFQMHDSDGDAQVTEAELTAMAAMMQSQMTGPQQGMPGAGQGMMNDNN
jgi:Ca2+-binding EF-hand superfamily protein